MYGSEGEGGVRGAWGRWVYQPGVGDDFVDRDVDGTAEDRHDGKVCDATAV